MKNIVYIFIILIGSGQLLYSQVAINPNGDLPDGSALLDVNSSSKGFLIPRMSSSEILSISNPAEGLMVFDNEQLIHVIFNGLSWVDHNEKHAICGTPLFDSRDSKYYNTTLIGDQCWMAENLNIGTMINGNTSQTDNNIIEKYCYNNLNDYCDSFGGLYRWSEMMEYELDPGIQGICPSGWHIPTDEEWKILEGTVDSQYGVGDSEWDGIGNRGSDAGIKLKSTTDWSNGGNGTDIFNLNILPGGRRKVGGFANIYDEAYLWTSTKTSSNWMRRLEHDTNGISRHTSTNLLGYSVRCLRNE